MQSVTAADLEREWAVLRKNLGLRHPELRRRIGPAVRLVCDINQGDSYAVAVQKLTDAVHSIRARVDDKLYLILSVELNMWPDCTADTLGGRQAWAAAHLSQGESTIRKWGERAVRVAASIMANDYHRRMQDEPTPAVGVNHSQAPACGDHVPVRTLDTAEDFSLPVMFESAQAVDLYTRSAVNFLNQYATQLATIARQGGRVRVLTLEPNTALGRHLYGLSDDGDAVFKRHVLAVAARVQYLRSILGDDFARLEFKSTQYIPPYGMFTAWKDTPAASKMVVQMNYLFTRTDRDRPLLCLDGHNPWFTTFAEEFEEAWNHASVAQEPAWVSLISENIDRVTQNDQGTRNDDH